MYLLIIFLPILTSIITGFFGNFLTKKGTTRIASGFIILTCILSYIVFYEVCFCLSPCYITLSPWIFAGSFKLYWDFIFDSLTATMLVVVLTISSVVHVYSISYMGHDPHINRFMSYLSLFTFFMIILVTANNYIQMFVGWEGVGLCSYLLINFWYTRIQANKAAIKAMLVNRVGDINIIFAIVTIFYLFKSVDYSTVFALAYNFVNSTINIFNFDINILNLICIFLFIGAVGKSAQVGLHVWLPDAMEGPTPVSALIHAATMVVAGVVQIARLFPIWIEYAPNALEVVVVVGAFTAFYAAAVACAQSDIKRVLAFSTISQIAFMMVSLGVCLPGHGGEALDNHAQLGYMASMFHLFTHAMFKACLFLGAGCIIHAVHSNEMSTMGGLRKYMPITHATFLISCLAIAGIPFFSGFSSKDEIITACFEYSPLCGWWMTGVAAMTAFYMFRLYYGIFWGTENKELHAEHTPHEAPATMTFPLIFLSVVTVGVGIFTTLGGFLNWDWASFGSIVSAAGTQYTVHFNVQIAATSTVIAILSIALATYIYKGEKQPIADKLYAAFPRLHRWAYKRFYMDEVYQFVTHKILFRFVSKPVQWIDEHIINGLIDFTAWGANEAGETIRPWQSGDVRQYALWFLTGTVALTLLLLCL